MVLVALQSHLGIVQGLDEATLEQPDGHSLGIREVRARITGMFFEQKQTASCEASDVTSAVGICR